VLGVPIVDTALVTFSRLRRGLNPLTTPGKDHISHRLVKLGHTQREAVLILYLAGCALGVISMYLTQASVIEGYVVGGLVGVVACYLLWRLERVGPLAVAAEEPPPGQESGSASAHRTNATLSSGPSTPQHGVDHEQEA
ncbi:MAG: hypothetical protein GX557_03375, partial [Chloroflexi bacterium]|nr:hypothetical protein [Chloroflexota bacterium]